MTKVASEVQRVNVFRSKRNSSKEAERVAWRERREREKGRERGITKGKKREGRGKER